MPTGVVVRDNESFEQALRRFKRKCEKAGILSEVKRRRFYEKPSERRKRQLAQARKKMLRKIRNRALTSSSLYPGKTSIILRTALTGETHLGLRRRVGGELGAHLVAVDPAVVADPVQVLTAACYAALRFARGANASRHVPIEVLLCLAGVREIGRALSLVSPRGRLRHVVLACLAEDEGTVREALARAARELGAEESEVPFDEARFLDVYGVTKEELGATHGRGRAALLKCALSRMARFTLS